MKRFIVSLFIAPLFLSAQDQPHLIENVFGVDSLTEKPFTNFIQESIPDSQFIFIGEQHGIKEVGLLTNTIFNMAHPLGYKTLCIETDAVLAEKLEDIATLNQPLEAAKKLNDAFPFAIPFYNCEDDYPLFKNVVEKGGHIWGIDQTFMAQFRLNFNHLIETTDNTALKKKLIPLRQQALDAYSASIAQKSFGSMFWLSYDKNTHESLMALSTDSEERDILQNLWKTKEIYGYNATKEYYKNNNERGTLMKANFTKYYKKALKKMEAPKVLFKLGATHATRGLSMTNIYDVSNYVSELAVFNDRTSLHFYVSGITGEALIGNPFAENPTAPFDNTEQLPKELQKLLPTLPKKYTIVHLAPLRSHAYGTRYSEAMKKYIFNFDVLVLVRNAKALKPL